MRSVLAGAAASVAFTMSVETAQLLGVVPFPPAGVSRLPGPGPRPATTQHIVIYVYYYYYTLTFFSPWSGSAYVSYVYVTATATATSSCHCVLSSGRASRTSSSPWTRTAPAFSPSPCSRWPGSPCSPPPAPCSPVHRPAQSRV